MVVVGGVALRHVHIARVVLGDGPQLPVRARDLIGGKREVRIGRRGVRRRDGLAPGATRLIRLHLREIQIFRADDVLERNARHADGHLLPFRNRARRIDEARLVERELDARHPVLAEVQRERAVSAALVEQGRRGQEIDLFKRRAFRRDADQRRAGQIVRQAGNDSGVRHGRLQHDVALVRIGRRGNRRIRPAGRIAEETQGAVERPIDRAGRKIVAAAVHALPGMIGVAVVLAGDLDVAETVVADIGDGIRAVLIVERRPLRRVPGAHAEVLCGKRRQGRDRRLALGGRFVQREFDGMAGRAHRLFGTRNWQQSAERRSQQEESFR